MRAVLLQNLLSSGVGAFLCAFRFRVKRQFAKKNFANLHGGADVEFLAGQLVSLSLHIVEASRVSA